MSRAYYNEYDPKAAAWIRELIRRGLIADGEVDERSILDVTADDLRGFTQCHFFAGIGGWSYALRLAGWPDDQPVWTGSPPCQPFSSAGRQKGKDDERHLAPHFVSLVGTARPRLLFGEQVASAAVFGGAAKGGRNAAPRAPEWAWFDDLSDRLEAAHYAVGASDIPAAGVGAAHIRQRTFFGAQRLDDPAGPRHDGPFAGPEGLARDEAWLRLFGAGSGHGGLADADADDTGSQGRPGVPERAGERLAGAHGMGGGLAHPLHARRPEWWPLAGDGSVAGGSGGLCGLGDPSGAAGQRHAGSVSGAEAQEYGARVAVDGRQLVGPEHAGSGLGQRPNAPDSPWSTPDWLHCRDGKWRPVESGTFPLAHGVSARVGRLRGYGNAINPWAAKAFIEAFDAAITDVQRNPYGF